MRRLIVLLLLVATVAGALLGPAAPSTARGALRWAYYVPDDPRAYQSLKAHHRSLDIVAPDAWRLHPDGSIRSRIQPAVIAQMRAWKLRVVPMVAKHTWSDRMHAFFASPAAQSRAARELAGLVVEGGYDGIHIAIEHVERRDAPALEALVADIAGRLHRRGKLVTMALPARTARSNTFPAFNYARLGRHLDLAVVMAYDHGYAAGAPAPVAPVPWVRAVVAYSVSQLPRAKLLLGVPWYGYDWNTASRRPARYIAFGEARSKQGERTYDAAVQAPTLQYRANGQRHVVWYENGRSVATKVQVATQEGLAGWAAWRLGYEDPAIWRSLAPRR